jgi:nitrogenase-stabilizing/protective protein
MGAREMTWDLAEFNKLVDAEEYFEFFQLPYDPQVVNVNRLHILRKFSELVKEVDTNSPDVNQTDKLDQYRVAFQQAYEVFLTSTPLEQKLFKVFNEKPQGVVLLKEINPE